ncbi:hypothetical protein, partial [Candidatus Frankia nodulisporulans]|uniref:hypothetical protein n=1 Tax=Candidatus Frankia nodulisporulans TaxID=2060052 RepID=UPI001C2E0D83
PQVQSNLRDECLFSGIVAAIKRFGSTTTETAKGGSASKRSRLSPLPFVLCRRGAGGAPPHLDPAEPGLTWPGRPVVPS